MFVALFALMVISAFGVSLLGMSMAQLTTAKRDTMRARALSSAEAGVQRAISFLRDTAPDGTTDGTWRTNHPSEDADDHDGDDWYEETLSTGETFKLCVRDGTDINAGKIVITSIGTVTNGSSVTTRTVEAIVVREEENVCVWNNVIFGGVGQSGKSINGNVVMRGSIHLLGDGETYTDVDGDGHWDAEEAYVDLPPFNGQYDAGEVYVDSDGDGHWDGTEPYDDVNGNGTRDPALTVTDIAEEIAGTANVGNNYSGMTAGLRSKLPGIPTGWWQGESVELLSSKLRVKHGKVNVSGSATVGDPDQSGGSPAVKETLNGVYVSDGWGGNQGSSSVYSDNGVGADYDLGDGIVSFPALTEAYTDAFGVSYPSYMDYLNANATVVAGPLNLAPGTAYSVNGPKGSLSIDGAGNMTVSGIVYVTGNINLNRTGGSTLTYEGSGTLVSTGSVYVHCNVLPKTTFATVDRIGIIARRRIELATGGGDSQLTLAGAFYAQEKIISQKQSEIAGTVVASYFQMQNVPHLYQVPALTDNLPPGMPGGDPIYVVTINVQSWREL